MNDKTPELFDILDENGVPLGIKKERSLVHKEGDWHNSVHIYVFNNKDELLVHLRAPFKDLRPDCWDTRFGGHVLAGETIEDTAVKELEEETGIKVAIGDLIRGSSYKWNGGINREFNNVFYYKWREGDSVNFSDGEVVEIKWMSIDEIIEELKSNPEKWTSRISTLSRIYEEWKKIGSTH
ncbi:MAG: NUDIX domain-containing protein [Candidatus Portnoybacteria bacterium]|nr:NUDIX domain-containing protein [Candidatus Portnoybacteria bacterium]